MGLPDKAVDEAKERVRSALRNSGADFPARRITVNLAPADLPKEGPAYDLPIAIGMLIASGQLQVNIEDSLFAGELSLDGRVRPITGVLLKALMAKEKGIKRLFVPEANAKEAAIVSGIAVYPVKSLLSLFQHLANQQPLQPIETITYSDRVIPDNFDFDMQDIKGQQLAKRALDISPSYSEELRLAFF
ncbi:hypothetical protein KJ980_03525 [Patescibacteria group bacterium]|nr:hypothetical protein [Patescibacteria group bacterium]MBU4016097.1 hypothetical protein [Patescibacteria group bacterium]MBU4098692.1 hypothetical protein [Patescibacteria group bacterium]